MTGPEHYRKAEELLGQADQLLDGDEPSAATWAIGRAQAHATLALAAATAIGTASAESRSWADAAGTKLPTGSTNRCAPRSLPARRLALLLREAGLFPVVARLLTRQAPTGSRGRLAQPGIICGVITLLVRVFSEQHRRHAAFLLLAAIACMLVGAGLFALSQDVPFTTALYWAITTATTVGYGDVTPHNAAGRVIASAVMLTTIPLLAAVFALVTGAAAVAGIRRILNVEDRFPAGTYRLILGMSPTVPAILEELETAGVPVVLAADVDPASVRRGVHVVRGDPTEPATVKSAKPEGAQQVLITGASDGDVLVSAVILRKQAPDVPITALVSSASVREALQEIGVQHAVSAQELLARTVATTLETPHAGEMVAQLVESGRDILAEVDAESAAVGKPLSVVRGERAGLVLGLVHAGRFTLGIGDDPLIAAGDRLLIAEATHRERRRPLRLPAR